MVVSHHATCKAGYKHAVGKHYGGWLIKQRQQYHEEGSEAEPAGRTKKKKKLRGCRGLRNKPQRSLSRSHAAICWVERLNRNPVKLLRKGLVREIHKFKYKNKDLNRSFRPLELMSHVRSYICGPTSTNESYWSRSFHFLQHFMSQFLSFPSIRSDRSPGWWKMNCTHTPAPPRVVYCWIHLCLPNHWCVSHLKTKINMELGVIHVVLRATRVRKPRSSLSRACSCLWASSWWDSQWVCLTRDKTAPVCVFGYADVTSGSGQTMGVFRGMNAPSKEGRGTHLMT